MVPRISVAILAGGKSSRFGGRDKQELSFRGEMLGRRVARLALGFGVPVLVVGSNPRPYQSLGLSIVGDRRPGLGPLSGLREALEAAPGPWVYLMACDMPFVEPAWFMHLASLAGAVEAGTTAIAASGRAEPEPFHALYGTQLLPEIGGLLEDAAVEPGRRSLSGLLRRKDVLLLPEEEVHKVLPDWSIFRGANDEAELSLLASWGIRQEKSGVDP